MPVVQSEFPNRPGLGHHHSSAHDETLLEYERRQAGGIACPKGCGAYENLQIHWKQAHDEPFPDDLLRMTDELRERRSEACKGISPTEETREKLSEMNKGKTLSEETRRKMSEAHREKSVEALPEGFREQMGQSNPVGINTEEAHAKISKALTGRKLSEEHVKSIVQGHQRNSGICSIPTRHTVRNKWELEVDLLLYDAGFDAEYEPETFDIGGRSYLPDFRVGKDIIEVKGYSWNDDDRRAELFMEHHPTHRYIVVGGQLPADVWVPWKERERLCEVVGSG